MRQAPALGQGGPRRNLTRWRRAESSHLLLSALLALVMVATAWAVGLPSHRHHQRVAAMEERVLLAALRAVPGVSVIPATAEHDTAGYGDGDAACAAVASVEVRTALAVQYLKTALGPKALPNLEVQGVGPGRDRVQVFRPFGYNVADWSCWE